MQFHAKIGLATAMFVCAVFSPATSPLAQAQITVTSPVNGSTVPSPVWLRAHTTCGGNPTAFGYSIDNSPFMSWGVNNSLTDIDNTDYRPVPGTHVVHFKAWSGNVACMMDSTVHVTGSVTAVAPNLDQHANDDKVGGAIPGWLWEHDPAAGKSTSNDTSYKVSSPTLDGQPSRIFYFDFLSNGGERYHLCFAGQTFSYNRCYGLADSSSHFFVYDTYIQIVHPENVQNVELDMNQATDSTTVYVFGTQCSSISKTWEYTTIDGNNNSHWNPSNIPCNPRDLTTWTANVWHHVQIAYHRDDARHVSYDSVTFDGKTTPFFSGAANVNSAVNQTWTPGDLLLNLQLDGYGNGSVQAYAAGLTILRW
jgi:hypothetical protein